MPILSQTQATPLLVIAALVFSCQTLSAQDSPGAGGTTEGLGGMTTSGLDTGGADEGGFAGANAATTFVGGSATDGGFVGGARESTIGATANRQFRGITDTGVVGSQQQQTGTRREIRVAFRVSFAAPAVSELPADTLAPANDVSLQRFAMQRPALSGVQVRLSPTGTATLTGVAPDASARRLAANLVRLQPGVRSVTNELVVAGGQ